MPHDDTELERLRDNEHREPACDLAAAYRHEYFGQDPPPRISARAT
jgi:hypothetical protein